MQYHTPLYGHDMAYGPFVEHYLLPGVLTVLAIGLVIALVCMYQLQRRPPTTPQEDANSSTHTQDAHAAEEPPAIAEKEPEIQMGQNDLRQSVKALRVRIAELRAKATACYRVVDTLRQAYPLELLRPIHGSGRAAVNCIAAAEEKGLQPASIAASVTNLDIAAGTRAVTYGNHLLDLAQELLDGIEAHQIFLHAMEELAASAHSELNSRYHKAYRLFHAATDPSSTERKEYSLLLEPIRESVSKVHARRRGSEHNTRIILEESLQALRALQQFFDRYGDEGERSDHRWICLSLAQNLASLGIGSMERYLGVYKNPSEEEVRLLEDARRLLRQSLLFASDPTVDAYQALEDATKAYIQSRTMESTTYSVFVRYQRLWSVDAAFGMGDANDKPAAWKDFDPTTLW